MTHILLETLRYKYQDERLTRSLYVSVSFLANVDIMAAYVMLPICFFVAVITIVSAAPADGQAWSKYILI